MSRVVIPLSDLPYPGPEGKHKVRFRITTKDYNEISEWSPVYILDSIGQVSSGSVEYSYDVVTSTSGRKTINFTWDDVNTITDIENHDIFIDWDQSGEYEYYRRVTGNNVSILAPVLADYVKIKVQMPSYPIPPLEDDIYKLFETTDIAL